MARFGNYGAAADSAIAASKRDKTERTVWRDDAGYFVTREGQSPLDEPERHGLHRPCAIITADGKELR